MMSGSIHVVRAARAICDRNWRWHNPPNRHWGLNLWFIAQGEGRLQAEKQTYELHPGDCFVLRMWRENLGEHNPDNPLVVPYIVFDYLDHSGRSLLPDRTTLPREHRRMPNISFFDELLQRVIDRCAEGAEGKIASDTWLAAVLQEIEWQDRRSLLSGLELEQSGMIDEISARMRASPEAFRDMRELARAARCSVDHFIRVFRKHKKVTPWEFLIQSRIEKARNLLRFSSHTVTQIADLLGYGDIYAFSKQFRARTGQSPLEYRKAK